VKIYEQFLSVCHINDQSVAKVQRHNSLVEFMNVSFCSDGTSPCNYKMVKQEGNAPDI